MSDWRMKELEEDLEAARHGLDASAERIAELEADLTAARAERDAIQHDLDAHLGNGAPAHECLVDKYRAACKDLNSQLAIADEANEKYRTALAAARADAHARLRAVKRMKRVARHWRKVVGEIKLVVVPHISK